MTEYNALLFMLLSMILFVSYIFHFYLDRFRMPHLLAPLFIGFVFQLLPFSTSFSEVVLGDAFYSLAQIGVIFLLFLVGLQLNVRQLKGLSKEIVVLSILNLALPSILGCYILLSFGYPPLVSAFVSTALATVAETTIAPVLDELGVIRTDVANLILGPGVVDDVVEVAIASMTSVVISSAKSTMNLTFPALGFLAFGAFALIFSKFIVPLLCRTCGRVKENQFFLLMVSIALIFTTASQVAELGVLLGAIIAGIIFQRFVSSSSIADVEAKTLSLLRATAYGFLGPIFFFGIGFSVDLSSFGKCIQLTLLLLAANFLGKFMAAFITGNMIKLNMKAVAIIGLGLSSKFSMGIIPVQIFFSANVIDQQLFSSFIAVSAITTMIVPFSLSFIINRWRQSVT